MRGFCTSWLAIVASMIVASLANSRAGAASLDPQVAQQARAAIEKGLHYLESSQQADGGWEAAGKSNPAVTALAICALVGDPGYPSDHPMVDRAVRFLLTHRQPDGGIYEPDAEIRNYQTSVALMALAAADPEQHRDTILDAQRFLRTLQWDEDEGHDKSSTWYGGQGYGKHKRPDLSNTQMMLEALQQSGLSADDPAYRKALIFISRCQMHASTNDQPFAAGSTDGGFIYTPANDGESMAGSEVVDGRTRLRSYGSMTYAGFKSLLYARLDRQDPRVLAAWDWIRRNYTLEHNPNMPFAQSKEGLYYYYYVFARALHAWGEPTVRDARGDDHDWRGELCRKMVSLQLPGGSWVNEADRWMEGNPHLVTAYAVLALRTALSDS